MRLSVRWPVMHSGWSEGLKDFPALVCFVRLEVACDVKSSSVSLQTSHVIRKTQKLPFVSGHFLWNLRKGQVSHLQSLPEITPTGRQVTSRRQKGSEPEGDMRI